MKANFRWNKEIKVKNKDLGIKSGRPDEPPRARGDLLLNSGKIENPQAIKRKRDITDEMKTSGRFYDKR